VSRCVHRVNKVKAILALVGFSVTLVSASAGLSAADEQSFIDLFGGTWVGTAKVLTVAGPIQASCHATGQPMANHIAIDGNCGVAIINVRIGADIAYDPETGTYSGSYVGAKVGPARVSGKREGSIVKLGIIWPQPVHGDTKARMTIQNEGVGSLRMTIFDNLTPGGPEQPTSDAVLKLGSDAAA
jgi:hypothetical protein